MRPFIFSCCIFLVLSSILVTGRSFLVVSETPSPADVVVQFVGPDDYERHAKAVDLVTQNLAPQLMIPAIFHLSERNTQGELVQLGGNNIRTIFPCEPWNESLASQLMENTHKELLFAKCAMDQLQFRSAILVSSPCHMRRIRLIADRVFDQDKYRIYCLAAESQTKPQSLWPKRMNGGG